MIIILGAIAVFSCSGPAGVQRAPEGQKHKATADSYNIDRPFPPGYYFNDELPSATVYLTFDDGPADWTEGILDALKRET